MLEIIIPGVRHGDGIMASSAYRGMLCYICGVDNDGHVELHTPHSSAQGRAACYPVDKIYYAADYGDTSNAVDLLKTGDHCLYYEGGEYETDQWYPSTFGLAAAYWASLETVSSTYGSSMYKHGFSTTLATLGDTAYGLIYAISSLQSIGTLSAKGTCGADYGLLGAHSSVLGAVSGLRAKLDFYVGRALAIHGSSSADARLRFRIFPSRVGQWGF